MSRLKVVNEGGQKTWDGGDRAIETAESDSRELVKTAVNLVDMLMSLGRLEQASAR